MQTPKYFLVGMVTNKYFSIKHRYPWVLWLYSSPVAVQSRTILKNLPYICTSLIIIQS